MDSHKLTSNLSAHTFAQNEIHGIHDKLFTREESKNSYSARDISSHLLTQNL
jgi:hypothetical protein